MLVTKAYDIKWDTDGNEEVAVLLPKEIILPRRFDKENYTEETCRIEDISNWLSDEYKHLHFDFKLEEFNAKDFFVKMNFIWDDGGDDVWLFRIIAPENISLKEVIETFKKEHKFLCTEDEDDIYDTYRRTPMTLLDYVCGKYGWQWLYFEFDIDISLI